MVTNKRTSAAAATVAPEIEEQLDEEQDRRDRFWKAIERTGGLNKDEDPDEVLADVTEVVEEVRQERYEQEQREAQGRR